MKKRPIHLGLLLLGVLFWVGCGESTPTEPGTGPGNDTGDVDDTPDPPSATCQPTTIPWLVEGNFWNVSWSWMESESDWWKATAYGDFDVGSYTMKLGPGTTVGDKTMFPLQLSGQVEEFGPMWSHVGSDGCGNVYGMTSSTSTPTLVYSETSDEWSGTGFWTDFADHAGSVAVTRNASMTPSQYTKDAPYFEPPLSRVGHSESESNYDPGGCEYFPGYGTICTDGSSGPSSGIHLFEYWDPEAGPVGMHFASDYEDCLGVACTEAHAERRIEVTFFGDVTSSPLLYEKEPDSYADPTLFPLSTDEVVTGIVGAISEYDTPSGYIPGYDAPVGMDLAAGIHDWYSFEITPAMAGRDVEFLLGWDDQVDLDFYLYSAPDHPIGFIYLTEAQSFDWPDFANGKFISAKYQEGTYLLGVVRNTEYDFETRYVVLGAVDGAGLSAVEQSRIAPLLRRPR